jgi:hypothetical protein
LEVLVSSILEEAKVDFRRLRRISRSQLYRAGRIPKACMNEGKCYGIGTKTIREPRPEPFKVAIENPMKI